jgi:signal transduction histidine kinase
VPASVSFTILPPIWRRWWFISLAVLAMCVTIYALYRYRVARLVEVANIRTRIASDLHDDIGSNLTRIAILSEVAQSHLHDDGKEIGSQLLSIAEISRESVASMSDIVWAINPKHDTLLDLVQRMRRFATEILVSRGIAFQFHAPEVDQELKLGANTRRNIFLVFKEALHNATRHSGCSSVVVDLKIERPWLILKIRDDGIGFDQEVAGDGHGFLSMTRRSRDLGGQLQVSSNPGEGTEIGLRVPL